jgi:hypothetical protein
MPKSARHPFDEAVLNRKRGKVAPHEFVLDALAPLSPTSRPMFGCLAVYVGEKIVLILRDRPDYRADNGVWIATTAEHHESLQRELPHMRSIRLFGLPVTNWQVLPAGTADFEEAALHACRLIRAGDPRIGKVPKRRVKSGARKKAASPARPAPRKAALRKTARPRKPARRAAKKRK